MLILVSGKDESSIVGLVSSDRRGSARYLAATLGDVDDIQSFDFDVYFVTVLNLLIFLFLFCFV